MEGEEEILSEGCTDGQLQGIAGYQEDGQGPECTDEELCGVRKGLDERIDEGVLRWFGHVEKHKIAKRVYVGERAGSRSATEEID